MFIDRKNSIGMFTAQNICIINVNVIDLSK